MNVAMRAVLFGVIVPARLAVEHHDHLTGHVVRGEQRRDETDHPQDGALVPGEQQDLVL